MGQTEGRDPQAHHPAGNGLGLKDDGFVAEPGQIEAAGQTGGAGADNGHLLLFRIFRRGKADSLLDRPIGEQTLDFPDGDRLRRICPGSISFRRRRGRPAADDRERIAFHVPEVGFLQPSLAHVGDVGSGVDAGGAGVFTGGVVEGRADPGLAFLLLDVLQIFVAEIFEGGKDGVGRGLAEAAERSGAERCGPEIPVSPGRPWCRDPG